MRSEKNTKSVETNGKEIWAENGFGKLASVRILRKLNINVRRRVKDTTVKRGDHFTYLGSEIEEDGLGPNFIKL